MTSPSAAEPAAKGPGFPEFVCMIALMMALNALAIAQPANAIGLYSSCTSGVQGFGVQLDTDDEGLSYLYEAYTRHFIYRYTDIRAPTSFIDGMAQYFASARFTDTQMSIGKTPLNVGSYWYFLDQGRRYSLDYTDVLEQNDSRGVNYASTAGIKLEFAARSWLLTHYMLSSEDKRKRMVNYLSAVYRDVPITQAFEQAYGIKAADLGTELTTAPAADATVNLVHRVRDSVVPKVEKETNGLTAYVGGTTAGNIDLADEITSSLPLVIATVCLLNMLVLLLAWVQRVLENKWRIAR